MSENKFLARFTKGSVLWIGVTISVIAVCFVLIGVAEIAYARLYEGRIFPGVRMLGVRLDGMTKEEARTTVLKAIDTSLANGLRFTLRDREVQLAASTQATDPDASRDLLQYDVDQALEQAYAYGRSHSWQRNIFEQLRGHMANVRATPDIVIDEKDIDEALHIAYRDVLTKPEDAYFTFAVVKNAPPLVHIENEKVGLDFEIESAMKQLRRQAEALSFTPIPLEERQSYPQIRRADLEALKDEAQAILQRPQLSFTYDHETYRISTSTLAAWLTVKQDGASPALDINDEAFASSVRRLIPNLESQAKKGTLIVEDGKIKSFTAGTRGTSLNVAKTLAPVRAEWPATSTFPLIVDVIAEALEGNDPERLGIREIIGVGRSNMAGSPLNRRRNITKGAEKVNGTIIAPGEEFSLLKTLGPIDGAHGWWPELVIKGDKTIPEFGGGLCQIGTTTFRGALDTGLKITQRRNHAYRVSYYEPAGTDATIYEPAPDMRFVNDTPKHIYINAYIKGNDIFFEFWGTEDGRKVDPIKPRIYNITSPPPTKLIETTDLAPGVKKCTESAHNGADAEFTYRIKYGDGTEHVEVFKSHYRPWQAVCMIGVEKAAALTPAQ